MNKNKIRISLLDCMRKYDNGKRAASADKYDCLRVETDYLAANILSSHIFHRSMVYKHKDGRHIVGRNTHTDEETEFKRELWERDMHGVPLKPIIIIRLSLSLSQQPAWM